MESSSRPALPFAGIRAARVLLSSDQAAPATQGPVDHLIPGHGYPELPPGLINPRKNQDQTHNAVMRCLLALNAAGDRIEPNHRCGIQNRCSGITLKAPARRYASPIQWLMAGVLVQYCQGYWWVLVGIGGIAGKFATQNSNEKSRSRGIKAGGINTI